MADTGGGIAGGLCGACCGAIVEALQFSWLNQSSAGIGICKCCDTLCRCKCCWDAGEFDPNDFPENQSKARESQTKAEENGDSLPAYSKAQEMKVPDSSANIESSTAIGSGGTEVIGTSNPYTSDNEASAEAQKTS